MKDAAAFCRLHPKRRIMNALCRSKLNEAVSSAFKLGFKTILNKVDITSLFDSVWEKQWTVPRLTGSK